MADAVPLRDVARIADPRDNVAIALKRLEAGTPVLIDGAPCPLSHTILEGHRFATRPISPGEPMLSWATSFGSALRPIRPGEAITNQSMIEALKVRNLGPSMPSVPNFADHLTAYILDESTFTPGAPVERAPTQRTFQGYLRPGQRGVGTRNVVVLLGTSSLTASFVRQLAARLQPLSRLFPGIDGIVPIAHTEGGSPTEPNNAPEVLRVLAGFMTNPNVGAVLAVDFGHERINNRRLNAFMAEKDYPLAQVPHAFLSVATGLAAGLAEGERLVRAWLPSVSSQKRSTQPASALRIALQCGGSDAFSGVSANPLAGAIVHEVVRQGGIGVLCETDELSGAEEYVMRNVKDLATAKSLLGYIRAFHERLGFHGVTPESNPSGGNKLRGLYNIALKSLGAVHKKDPRSRIEQVIDYAEPLRGAGFTFMNSPGNDLEGIAGQAAAGCNLFLFATGNGSITNFPFVPTLKLTTTTRRHQLLEHEMDINAGRYLDGESMDSLAEESVQLLLDTASGKRTKGELAGHSQTSLWRNWKQTDRSQLDSLRARPAPDGIPLVAAEKGGRPEATQRIGLILPTSMCSAQIARMAAERMNRLPHPGIGRFVALAHSEGCGFGGESMYGLLHRTYRGYATHPSVASALLLEHGCEKIPNDMMRRQFEAAGLPLERFGWASVQLDGGIHKSLEHVQGWFDQASTAPTTGSPRSLGLLCARPPSSATAKAFAALALSTLRGGGSVVIAEGDPLLASQAFLEAAAPGTSVHATLSYGEPIRLPGLHVEQTESDHWVENLTGIGASGVHGFVGLVGDSPQQGHPFLPVLQVCEGDSAGNVAAEDIDLVLRGDLTDVGAVDALVNDTFEGRHVPASAAAGFTDFQLSRGLLGVST